MTPSATDNFYTVKQVDLRPSINLCNSTYHQEKMEAPEEGYSDIELLLIVFGAYCSLIIFSGICLLPLVFCIRICIQRYFISQKCFINKRCNDRPPTYDQLVLSKQDLPKFKDKTVIKL